MKRFGMIFVIFALMLGTAFPTRADGAPESAWAWLVTVEDPQGRMGATASLYLLTDAAMALESLDSAIANGTFDAQIASRRFLVQPGRQQINFKVPYELFTFNQHGIYVLFSDADPSKSQYYSIGYFSAFRDKKFGLPPVGIYQDSNGELVPCHCNMSTVTFANAKRTRSVASR